jgi:diaminopimelate epimerase
VDEGELVAEVRIFNPDGSEAELSGNGVRQAVMYLRRNGWTEDDSFSVRTAAGEIRPRIDGELCTMDIGHVRLRADADYPAGGDDGIGALTSAGRDFDFQFVQVGNPQVSIEVQDGLEELDLGRYGPEIERHELFPNRANVSFWNRTGPAEIRARIFERGVGETMSSGTGATGAAVAAFLRGVRSPVTVVLDGGELAVDVSEDMRVELTGWARPVFAGTLSDEFLKELNATE